MQQDSFNMACQDKISGLELNINVNSKSLLPLPQKYVGSLRLPPDPSWPKIPHRRLTDDSGDSEYPYLPSLKRKSQKICTVVQTSESHSRMTKFKENSNNYQATQVIVTNPPRRRPGCVDPRFKRVLSVKSQAASVESQKEHEFIKDGSRSAIIIPNQSKSLPEKMENKNLEIVANTQCSESCSEENEDNTDSSQKNNLDSIQKSNIIYDVLKESDSETCNLINNISKDAAQYVDMEKENEMKKLNCHPPLITDKLGDSGQIIVLVPQKNMQSIQNLTAQCYKVPILTYQNLPTHVSTDTCEKVNLHTDLIQHNTEIIDHNKIREDAIQNSNLSPRMTNNSKTSAIITSKLITKINESNNEILKNKVKNSALKRDIYVSDTSIDSNYKSRKNIRRRNSNGLRYLLLKKKWSRLINTDKNNLRFYSRKYCVQKSSFKSDDNFMENERLKHLFAKERLRDKKQSVQYLTDEDKLSKNFQSNISNKSKHFSSFSKNARSFIRKKTHFRTTESECTVVQSNNCKKRRYSQQFLHKLNIRNKEKFMHLHKKALLKKSRNHIKSKNDSNSDKSRTQEIASINKLDDLTVSNNEDILENPTTLSPQTQELLNKSYWDYLKKLRHDMDSDNLNQQYLHQLSMGAPLIKKWKGSMQQVCNELDSNQPEDQTLQRCTVLSTMINKTLDKAVEDSTDENETNQLFRNGILKSSSNQTAASDSAIMQRMFIGFPREKYEDSIASSTFYKRLKYKERRNIEFKTIVFFGGMMIYALFIILPVMYNYIFNEDYSDYENSSYTDIFSDYVLWSTNEIFTNILDSLNRIFFAATN